MFSTICLIAAAICFALKALEVQVKIDLMNAGFFFVVLSMLV